MFLFHWQQVELDRFYQAPTHYVICTDVSHKLNRDYVILDVTAKSSKVDILEGIGIEDWHFC